MAACFRAALPSLDHRQRRALPPPRGWWAHDLMRQGGSRCSSRFWHFSSARRRVEITGVFWVEAACGLSLWVAADLMPSAVLCVQGAFLSLMETANRRL